MKENTQQEIEEDNKFLGALFGKKRGCADGSEQQPEIWLKLR
jgi:hypothetical protein